MREIQNLVTGSVQSSANLVALLFHASDIGLNRTAVSQ